MMALGELVTVSVLPLVRAVTWPATVFMPVGRACARTSCPLVQKVTSEHAARACTIRRGLIWDGCSAAARRHEAVGAGRPFERWVMGSLLEFVDVCRRP